MESKQIVYSRVNVETVEYLESIAQQSDRSRSNIINRILTDAVEKHKAAKTGNRASLDLLQLLGPSPEQAPNSKRNG